MPTIADIVINAHTYTDAMWRADPEGTLSGIGNDISTIVGALANSLGILTKAISGNTTLSGSECVNIGFVFTGSLSGNANITFAASFNGMAQIENQTTGGFSLVCGLVGGDQVTVPPSGSAATFCDGTDFSLRSGIVRTSAGAKVVGNLEVTGTESVSGAMTVAGSLSVTGAQTGSTLNLSGAATVGGILNVTGNLDGNLISGTNGDFTGTLNVDGATDLGGVLGVGGLASFSNGISLLVGNLNLGDGLLNLTAQPFVDLPVPTTAGTLARVTNSSVNTWGSTADGAGALPVLVMSTGAIWKVIG